MADKTIPDLTDGGAPQAGDLAHVVRGPNSRKVALGTAAGSATADFATATQGGKADTAVQPGDLGNSASRNVGTTAGTVAAGDDSRITGAVPSSRTLTAGTGLTGGGDLSANRTFNVSYGTTAGTAAQGNDSRLSDSREWTADTVTQAEAEAGTGTTRRAWTAQRVAQAIAALALGASRSATSVIGRAANSSGAAADIQATTNNTFLQRVSNALVWGTLSSLMDLTFGSTRGMILRRGASAWEALAKGTTGQVLTAGANDPAWSDAPAGGWDMTGQSWQDVSASRSNGTSYQNTTGKPIVVNAIGDFSSSISNSRQRIQTLETNSGWAAADSQSGMTVDATGGEITASLIIPPNWYYQLSGRSTGRRVWELR